MRFFVVILTIIFNAYFINAILESDTKLVLLLQVKLSSNSFSLLKILSDINLQPNIRRSVMEFVHHLEFTRMTSTRLIGINTERASYFQLE